MTASFRQAETVGCPDQWSTLEPHDFPVIDEAENAWSKLDCSKVFKSAGSKATLDCIDVLESPNGDVKRHQVVFQNSKNLDEYLTKTPMRAGIRLM